MDADDARYELRTGHGIFHHARGTFALQRRPTPTLLLSPNPLYFDAEEAERLDENTYRVRKVWLTVCKPGRARMEVLRALRNHQVAEIRSPRKRRLPRLLSSDPVLPYATLPAEKRRDRLLGS